MHQRIEQQSKQNEMKDLRNTKFWKCSSSIFRQRDCSQHHGLQLIVSPQKNAEDQQCGWATALIAAFHISWRGDLVDSKSLTSSPWRIAIWDHGYPSQHSWLLVSPSPCWGPQKVAASGGTIPPQGSAAWIRNTLFSDSTHVMSRVELAHFLSNNLSAVETCCLTTC